MKKKNGRAVLLLCVSVLIVCVFCDVLRLSDASTLSVYNGTVRLRVIADSDDPSDQAVKYAVRDALIREAGSRFTRCRTVTEAVDEINASMPFLQMTAERTVRKMGADCGVKVRLLEEAFPVRTYGHFTFPAGTYLSLHVELGSASGRNWFCVMYPPLCLNAACDSAEEGRRLFASCGFSQREIAALENGSEKREVKLAAVELMRDLFLR